MLRLSICMIVKNEEVMIGKCLESVKEADEIVILDTGSTDKSGEIIMNFPYPVSTDVNYVVDAYKWNDNFAEARNKALEYCTGDYVLTIDADEALELGGIGKIRDFINATNDDAVRGHMVINVDVVGSDGKSKHLSPRIYWKCPDVFWKGAIHNYLSKVATVHLPVVITYGYSPAHQKDPDRALNILLKEVARDPGSARELFYLAREYVYRKDYITALYWYDLYIQVGLWAPELAEAYLQMSTCLWYLYRGEEARYICMKAIQINANFKEAIKWMASISGPKNKIRWIQFSEKATNEDVLFVR